jgi:hypothetical protein
MTFRLMRVPAEHPTMPGSHKVGFAADPGSSSAAGGNGAAAPTYSGNPLVLAAKLAAVAAVVRLAYSNSIRSRVAGYVMWTIRSTTLDADRGTSYTRA